MSPWTPAPTVGNIHVPSDTALVWADQMLGRALSTLQLIMDCPVEPDNLPTGYGATVAEFIADPTNTIDLGEACFLQFGGDNPGLNGDLATSNSQAPRSHLWVTQRLGACKK